LPIEGQTSDDEAMGVIEGDPLLAQAGAGIR